MGITRSNFYQPSPSQLPHRNMFTWNLEWSVTIICIEMPSYSTWGLGCGSRCYWKIYYSWFHCTLKMKLQILVAAGSKFVGWNLMQVYLCRLEQIKFLGGRGLGRINPLAWPRMLFKYGTAYPPGGIGNGVKILELCSVVLNISKPPPSAKGGNSSRSLSHTWLALPSLLKTIFFSPRPVRLREIFSLALGTSFALVLDKQTNNRVQLFLTGIIIRFPFATTIFFFWPREDVPVLDEEGTW